MSDGENGDAGDAVEISGAARDREHADARERRRARRIAWAVRAGGVALRALAATWRVREYNREPLLALQAAGRPVIYTFWHGRLLPLFWHHRRLGIAVLISEHGDGEIIARLGTQLGYRTVRGSTTRGAGRALLGLIRVLEQGTDAAVSPDGPRGPAESFAPGTLVAAQRSGAALALVSAGADRAWRLRSWDRFMIPKPFARVTVRYADPILIESASAREAIDRADEIAARLRALTEEVDG